MNDQYQGLPASTGLGRRPVLAVSGAAVVVLLGGLLAVLSGHPPGTAAAAAGTTAAEVSGCAPLTQAGGTLAQVNSGGLVIRPAGGQPVTVRTSGATGVAVSGAPLSDITDGAPVAVAGPSSGGKIAAARVAIGGKASLAGLPGTVVAQGSVADAGPGGFTVVTPSGVHVPVTTSSGTSLTLLPASLGQLRAGATTIALGHIGPGGVLSAIAVFQPPAGPGEAHVSVAVGDCSPSAIGRALKGLASAG